MLFFPSINYNILNNFSGKFDSNGQFHPGLLSLLNLLYINKFVECPEQAKECMMFFRTENSLMDINDDLSELKFER